MVATGLIITVIGIAVVFAFLFIMVQVIDITGRIIQMVEKRWPQAQPPAAPGNGGGNNNEEIAAVIAAIHAL
ncbi:MAG: OadG family protein [bacterium]|jgi:sodium pump decarboxylase gamma subunit|nr:OadG family protein [bacterium]MDD3805585.1 OadG family protein [bacterium]MDD4153029.1 OadG family protein [bacterium]